MDANETTNCRTVCIPRLPINITKLQICGVFKQLRWGKIGTIRIIKNTRKKDINNIVIPFACVFIDISWHNDANSVTIKNKLIAGKCIKVVCDQFTFWKVYAKSGNGGRMNGGGMNGGRMNGGGMNGGRMNGMNA
jgi:hypothetical protein